MAQAGFSWEDEEPITQPNNFTWDEESGNSQGFLNNLVAQLKAAKGSNPLETAGNVADIFNKGIERAGIPSAARGVLQGTQDIIRGVGNLPHDVASIFGYPNAVPSIPEINLPEVQGVNPNVAKGAEMAGEILGSIPALKGYQAFKSAMEGTPYIRRLPEAIRGLLAGAATGSAISPENRTQGAAIGSIGGALEGLPPFTQRGASKHLRKASELVNQRGVGPLNVPTENIEDLRQFLPATLPYRKLMEEAQGKEYGPLFNLQSDVGKQARDYAKSIFSAAERAHGREGLAARDRLLDEIRSGLIEKGHGDIAELMKKGQNQYRRYSEFKPLRNKAALGTLGAIGLGGGYEWLKHLLK